MMTEHAWPLFSHDFWSIARACARYFVRILLRTIGHRERLGFPWIIAIGIFPVSPTRLDLWRPARAINYRILWTTAGFPIASNSHCHARFGHFRWLYCDTRRKVTPKKIAKGENCRPGGDCNRVEQFAGLNKNSELTVLRIFQPNTNSTWFSFFSIIQFSKVHTSLSTAGTTKNLESAQRNLSTGSY